MALLYITSSNQQIMFIIFGLILRVIGVAVCSNKAQILNRNAFGWGLFGFIYPVIAMIWIHLLKPKVVFETQHQ